MMLKATCLALALAGASSCAVFDQAGPGLRTVLARVDVPRLLECADAGEPKEIAKCLGAEALTQGLELALDQALKYAREAQAAGLGGAGAADMTPEDEAKLAAQLDAALDQLAQEIAATHQEG